MARVQLRNPTEGRAYYDRKKADGKAPMEAMRCVKRRLSDIVYRTMLDDAVRPSTDEGRAREDNGDTTLNPARPAHNPTPALRTSHFPDPPTPSLEPAPGRLLTQRGARYVRCQRIRPSVCAGSYWRRLTVRTMWVVPSSV